MKTTEEQRTALRATIEKKLVTATPNFVTLDLLDDFAALEKERDELKAELEESDRDGDLALRNLDKCMTERDELRAFVKIISDQGLKPNGMMDSAFGLVPNQVRQAATELLDRIK